MKVLDMADSAAAYGGAEAPNQTQKLYFDHQPLNPIATESSLGTKTMLNFGGVKRSGNLVFSSFDQEEFGDEYLDEYLNQQEKKRRLTVDQVQFLERSFEADNKLEPERKTQLANELGLQPRQIAVWFQNRRARYKTKRVETDYETLHARYQSLKTDYDALLKENDKLKAEVLRLKEDGLGGYTKNADSQMLDSREVHEEVMPREGNAHVISADEEYKNEEQSSARSEVTTNVESPRLTDGINSPLLELRVTSHVFDPDYSDSSQNGENHLHDYPRFEDAHDHHPPLSSFYYGFPVEDHHAFNFW